MIAILCGPQLCKASTEGQFDLNCRGTTKSSMFVNGSYQENVFPSLIQIRVDLTSREWCSDECDSLSQIISIDENSITFINMIKDGEPLWVMYVNRRTGLLDETFNMAAPKMKTRSTYQCDVGAFSGFRPQKF